VWGYHQREILDPGDVEEGLRAAAAIGDDVLQRRAGRDVAPESWTHGSAAMRVRWLKRGLDTGDMSSCDTFDEEP
jgi:predicted metalloprotease